MTLLSVTKGEPMQGTPLSAVKMYTSFTISQVESSTVELVNVIAPGVVIEPTTMLREIEGLEARGITPRKNLLVSERAHLVMPWHLVEDQILNSQVVQGGENIGTTLRGIGPCYRDKVGRTFAVRLVDILGSDLQTRIGEIVEAKAKVALWSCNTRANEDA